MRSEPVQHADARDLRVALVASRYHAAIVDALADGAAKSWAAAGGRPEALVRIDAPGAFELPVVAAALARRDDVDGVVCLGLVLAGETTHDQYLSHSVAHALQEIALETGKPVGFGVLTCTTLEQATARAGGVKGNKGEEAIVAVIGAIRSVAAARRAGRA